MVVVATDIVKQSRQHGLGLISTPVAPVNILSTGGDFSYKKGKLTYKAKGGKASISLEDALGPTSQLLPVKHPFRSHNQQG